MAAKANVAPGNASETRMDEGSGAPGSRISDDPPPLGRRLRAAFGFGAVANGVKNARSEEHTSELQSLMRISYAVFCLKKNKTSREINEQIITQPLITKY